MSDYAKGIKQIMEELKTEYVASLPLKRSLVHSLWEQNQLSQLEDEFHKMKGTGQTYGVQEISDLGRLFEGIAKLSQLDVELMQQFTLWIDAIFSSRSSLQSYSLAQDQNYKVLCQKYLTKD